jgi:phosphoglycerate dehydrogenase-like enzyme
MPDGAADGFRAAFPDVVFHEGKELFDDFLPAINAMFVTVPIKDDVIDRMDNLKWIHSTYGGVGAIMTPAVVARSIMISSSKGTHSVPFTEFTIAAMFAMAKHIQRAVLDQDGLRWDHDMPNTVEFTGKTIGIVGLGAIGQEIARSTKAFGMRVVATKRSIDGHIDNVDWVKPPGALNELLAESDFVILALPNTEATAGLINEQTLRAMKPTSYLINLTARNAIPDEEIVARALREGWIAGACFNVFNGNRGEIADDSPLWDAPNFLISPRLAALDPRKWDRLRDLFSENLRRFIAGEPLINAGSAEVGY